MQDWWTYDENSFSTLTDYIQKQNFERQEDRTIYHLYSSEAWKSAIWEKKNWLVTNAVWGARIGKASSGMLPVNTHKAAFAIWYQLIKSFAANNGDFKVVFAGAWSSSKEERKCGRDLNGFLESWKEWVDRNSTHEQTNICGKAYFCQHPSQWWKSDLKYANCLPS
jgi:hypothetical protein